MNLYEMETAIKSNSLTVVEATGLSLLNDFNIRMNDILDKQTTGLEKFIPQGYVTIKQLAEVAGCGYKSPIDAWKFWTKHTYVHKVTKEFYVGKALKSAKAYVDLGYISIANISPTVKQVAKEKDVDWKEVYNQTHTLPADYEDDPNFWKGKDQVKIFPIEVLLASKEKQQQQQLLRKTQLDVYRGYNIIVKALGKLAFPRESIEALSPTHAAQLQAYLEEFIYRNGANARNADIAAYEATKAFLQRCLDKKVDKICELENDIFCLELRNNGLLEEIASIRQVSEANATKIIGRAKEHIKTMYTVLKEKDTVLKEKDTVLKDQQQEIIKLKQEIIELKQENETPKTSSMTIGNYVSRIMKMKDVSYGQCGSITKKLKANGYEPVGATIDTATGQSACLWELNVLQQNEELIHTIIAKSNGKKVEKSMKSSPLFS